MSFHIVRIDRERLSVAVDRRVVVPSPMQDVGKMQTGFAMPLIYPDRLFEMLPRAVQVVDSSEPRSERDMIFDAPARDSGGTIEQPPCFFHSAKLAAHHREPAQGAKVARLVGQQAAIGLLR